MSIIETRGYTSATLIRAPQRLILTEAEADEARGIELAAYMALLPTLTFAQLDAAQKNARNAGFVAVRAEAFCEANDASRASERGAALDNAVAVARGAARDAERPRVRARGRATPGRAAYNEARLTALAAELAAVDAAAAIVTRDLITAEQFAVLTAPMRAAGVDFTNLAGTP